MIRKAGWRLWTSLAVSALGLATYIAIYFWLYGLMGHEEFIQFLTEPLSNLVLVALPGVGAVVLLVDAIRSLLWGDRIILSGEGFRVQMARRSRFVRWSNVKRFRAERPFNSMHAVVGWDHYDDAFNGNLIWEGSKWEGHRVTTVDAHIGWGWQGGAEKVCSTLEDWRIRHSHSFIPEKERGAVTDIGRGAPDLPSSLTVHADARKSLGPLLVISVCFLGLFALPIWISVRAGRGLTFWAGLVGHWNFWLVAATYAALGLWLGYYACALARRILMKPTIVLTPEGFEVNDEAGRQFTRWNDIDAFGIAYCSRTHREYVGWRFKSGVAKVESWSKPSFDLDASAGMGWQGSVRDLRDTFDEWRRRYGDR